MSGEKSKKSGEIGELLSSLLLERIGWKKGIQNMPIDCTNKKHTGSGGAQRVSHGEDAIFIYDNPFHDDRTDIVHVSSKNHLDKYPQSIATLRSTFKKHLAELLETVDCAKHSEKIAGAISTSNAKPRRNHVGLLIWLQDDLDDSERDIKKDLSGIRTDANQNIPVYLIDSERASFLVKVMLDIDQRRNGAQHEFYYPRIGTAMSERAPRSGQMLPLELIASDIIPLKIEGTSGPELVLYANEPFTTEIQVKLTSYALSFGDGWVKKIHIGTKDYNPTKHENEAAMAKLPFRERNESISAFNFSDNSFISLLNKGQS
jgi:hypothetical protein